MSERLLRQRDVLDRTGLSGTSLWRLEHRGDFPQRRRLGPNMVGWLESEITAWLRARPVVVTAGAPDADEAA